MENLTPFTVPVLRADMNNKTQSLLSFLDITILTVLTVEFTLRLWSSQCKSKYQGMLGMVKYLYAPFRIIDMVVIVSSGIVVWADMIHRSDTDTIYWLRFLQVFQALRLEKRFQPWRIMASVIWSQKEHILITIYIAFLSFLIISFGVYFAERNHPNTQFTSIASSMWWSIVTMYTIGYGDMVPQTTSGKILSTCLIIVGVSIFALPAGILGTGLALKVCKHNSLYNKGFMFLIPG